MNNRERIINFLSENSGKYYCDDCLSEILEIYPRQQPNQICRKLFVKEIINRSTIKEECYYHKCQKLVNWIGEQKYNNLNIQENNNTILYEATKKVIKQNESLKFIPHRFIIMTEQANAKNNLKEVISRIVLDCELLEYLEKAIAKYGEILTIEDLISQREYGFGLSEEVITQAKARSELFNTERNTNNNWIINLMN